MASATSLSLRSDINNPRVSNPTNCLLSQCKSRVSEALVCGGLGAGWASLTAWVWPVISLNPLAGVLTGATTALSWYVCFKLTEKFDKNTAYALQILSLMAGLAIGAILVKVIFCTSVATALAFSLLPIASFCILLAGLFIICYIVKLLTLCLPKTSQGSEL